MDKNYGILIICTVILSLCFVGAASAAKMWYVDDDGGSDFMRIQDAITAASVSDTIIVRDGMYTENIAVNKQLTIKSENGYASTTVQAANTRDHVFEVTKDHVTIQGFTVKNSTFSAGISLKDVDHCNITNNKVSNNRFGISLSNSSNCNISYNNASSNNFVMANIASNNYGGIGFSGISSYLSNNNSIKNSSYNNQTNTPVFPSYLFSWDSVPGDDNKTLVNSLKDDFDVDWVEDAEISKYHNGTTINISTDEHTTEIIMEMKKEKALLKISDGRTYRIKVERENDKKPNKLEKSDRVGGPERTIESEKSDRVGGPERTIASEKSDRVGGPERTIASKKRGILRLPRYSSVFPKFPLIKTYGIYLISSSNNNIKHNIANSNNGSGISLNDLSNNNAIINNTVNFNLLGIDIHNSNNNNIRNNNNASFNKYFGIYLDNSSRNKVIKDNNASSNEYFGILLDSSDNNTITGNYANSTKNGTGIYLYTSSSHNTIEDNTANSNSYDGIAIGESSDHNTIRKNNIACFNNESGIILFSCKYNNVTNNTLSSNSFGLSLITSESKSNSISNYKTTGNQIVDNNATFNKYYGIFLWNLHYPNNITNNNASNNDLFGIFVLNSTNHQAIINNTANFNERGIGLHESRDDILLINNTANSNNISGISLINSTKNILHNNTASFNTYEGIYLSNSNLTTISKNNVSSNNKSYFGISLYSSYNNTITNNIAESNYYSEVFLYPSKGNNTINNNTWDIQEDGISGVRLHLLTPSFQIIGNRTNASYYIVVENLGNSRDTFSLSNSSVDKPKILSLNRNNVSLDAGAEDFSTNTISEEVKISQLTKIEVAKTNVETIKLTVGDTKPGIYRVKVTARSENDAMVKDIIETRTLVTGIINSPIVDNETINRSAIINSTINNSIINRSAIINNSTINNSIIEDSIINNSTVVGTKKKLRDVILEDAIVNKGIISSGNITINGIRYKINTETRISNLVIGTDYHNSSLVGIKNKTLINVEAKKSNISFDIRAEADYFAGSMKVQESRIPPEGIPEFTNNVVSYVYANVSENLNNSIDWVIIKVFYDQDKLDELRYFNKSAGKWDKIEINFIENYSRGNISHFSVFALIAQPPVDGGRDGGIRPLPEEIIIHIANPDINIFNFEWLGLDITKISIDLKSVTINAKVALKKIDKPAEIPDPPGIVFGYFDISTNIKPEKIRASKIHFKILKSWTVVNDVNAETIKLWRYANGWEELETAKIKEDDNYLHFYAETKCFFLFAITGWTPTPPPPTQTPTESPTPSQTPTPSPIPSPTVPPTVSPTPFPDMGGAINIIIMAIVALAIAVSVTYLVLRRRKT